MNESDERYLAPGARPGHAVTLPGARPSRPMPSRQCPPEAQSRLPVDEHAVTPETREQFIDGHVVYASPANPPHADRHLKLSSVLDTSVAPGYIGSTDLLTRTSERWNFATDASIRQAGKDPQTGRRYLEELAFEIKSTQSLRELTQRARELSRRGVRRIFTICVEASPEDSDVDGRVGPVLEWSADEDDWRELADDSYIEDRCLQQPIKVGALLDAAEADAAVARAVIAQRHPVVVEFEAASYSRGEANGLAQGLRTGILDLCAAFDIEVTADRRARLDAMDVDALHSLRAVIKKARRWDTHGR